MSDLTIIPTSAAKPNEGTEGFTSKDLACSEDTKYNLAYILGILQPELYGPKTMKEVLFLREMNANEVKDRIELAQRLKSYNIEIPNFDSFIKVLQRIIYDEKGKSRELKLKLVVWKPYCPKDVNELWSLCCMNENKIKSRIEFAAESEKKDHKKITFSQFRDTYLRPWEKIKKKLREKKRSLLMRNWYIFGVDEEKLDDVDTNEVSRIGEIRRVLRQYGIKLRDSDFEKFWKIVSAEDLKVKLELLKWKSYAPTTLKGAILLDKIDIDEIKSRIYVATKLEQYGIEIWNDTSSKYEFATMTIKFTEDLDNKLKLFIWKSYAPMWMNHVEMLDETDIDEVKRRIDLATKWEEYGIKIYFENLCNLSEI